MTLSAQINVDSLFAIWNDTTQPDTTRLKAMDDLFFKHYLMTDADSAYFHAQQMLDFATKKGLKMYQANALHNMGAVEKIKGSLKKSLELNNRSLVLREEIGDKKGIGRSLANIGGILDQQGDRLNGLHHYERALVYFEEIGNNSLTAHALNNIGSIYSYLGNYPKAIQYISRSMDVLKGSDDGYFKANTLLHLASICLEIEDFAKAKKYGEMCKDITKKINYRLGESYALLLLGYILSEEGKHEGSLAYCEEALLLNKKTDDIDILLGAYQLMATNYQQKGDYDKALDFFEKSQKLAESSDRKDAVIDNIISMGQVYILKKVKRTPLNGAKKGST